MLENALFVDPCFKNIASNYLTANTSQNISIQKFPVIRYLIKLTYLHN